MKRCVIVCIVVPLQNSTYDVIENYRETDVQKWETKRSSDVLKDEEQKDPCSACPGSELDRPQERPLVDTTYQTPDPDPTSDL